MAIESSEPVEYLGSYIATCKSSIIFFSSTRDCRRIQEDHGEFHGLRMSEHNF